MADDVEALIGALGLEDVVVFGWSFGSFVAQSHMVGHGSAAAYVLMGTVAEPGALAQVARAAGAVRARVAARAGGRLLGARGDRRDARRSAEQLWHDQIPFQVADPTGPLVAQLVADDRVVFRPEVLRHFAAGGEYGMADLRDELRRVECRR